MKKLVIFFLLLLCLTFASSISAEIYKWVDKEGVVNFTDDESRVPSAYRDKVEKMNTAKLEPSTPSQTPAGKAAVYVQPGTETPAPPVAQTLIREGDFALKLAETLKIGQANSEAEAESMLAAIGITPRNGWIADYPVTPDIIGELEKAIGSAVDSGKLGMSKEEAVKTFLSLAAEQGLPVAVDERENPGEPPGDYGESEAVSNYYYTEGPPVVTYYPPPWDYSYLYAWVPYPFWYTGFWFPGFFVLSDFHVYHGRHCISNHVIDPRTRASHTVDPTTRATGAAAARASRPTGSRGFASPAARTGAASILNRSANSRGLREPGLAGRQFRGSQSPSSGSVRSYSRNFSTSSGRTYSAPSTGGPGSIRGFRDGSYSRGFQSPSTGSTGSLSRSFDSPSGRTFSAPSTGGSGSFGGSYDGGNSGGFRGGFGSSYGGGYGGGGGGGHGGGHGGGGFGGSYGGGHGGGGGGGHR